MAAIDEGRQEKRPGKTAGNTGNDKTAATESGSGSSKIDPTAPAGSENSLGAESVRDGRPNTDDSTVEAIDEEGPGVTAPPSGGKDSARR